MPISIPETVSKTAPPAMDEADIGSGEKTPGERDTEELIMQIPVLPDDDDPDIADDTTETVHRLEQEQSLDKDEPDFGLDNLDPVPPKGG